MRTWIRLGLISFLGMGLLSACSMETSVQCDAATFEEYCFGSTPVKCIDGIETEINTCSIDSICMTFTEGLDRAHCVDGGFDAECDPTKDNIERKVCRNHVVSIYRCHYTDFMDYFWEPVDSVECQNGCNDLGTDCF